MIHKEIRRSIGKAERHERRATSWFLIPSIAGVLLFFILPFFVVIYYSVVDNPINREFVFFDNYIKLFGNSAFMLAVKNTLRFSLIAVPAAVVLSLLLAVILDANIPFKTQFRTVFITPLMVPVASIVLIWQVIFHQNGALNEITALFGTAPIDWLKSDYSQIVIVTLYLWKNIGYNMILFMAALSNIPADIIEVSTIEGANAFQRFFYIKLRYLSSSIFFVTILSLINSFKVFREVYLLTGDYPYDSLYLLQHFMNNTFRTLDYQKLSTAAIIMCLAMIIIIGVMLIIDNRIGRDLDE
jgi:multiple sugar transport system permease protein